MSRFAFTRLRQLFLRFFCMVFAEPYLISEMRFAVRLVRFWRIMRACSGLAHCLYGVRIFPAFDFFDALADSLL